MHWNIYKYTDSFSLITWIFDSILYLQQSVINICCLLSLLKSLIYIKMSTEVDILKIYIQGGW